VLAGACFGGWIAAEMAVARHTLLRRSRAVGGRSGSRWAACSTEIRRYAQYSRADFLRLAWADPAKGAVDYASLPDTALAAIARARESLALFGWKPYMHNPRLKRWLQPDRSAYTT